MSYLPQGYLPKSKYSFVKSDLNLNSDEPLLYQLIDWRKKKNKDTIIAVVGEKRSGKSYDCGKIAEDLARKWNISFSVKNNVFFEIEDLLIFMNSQTDNICIVEEAGLLLNAQDWASIEIKIIRDMTQTQGFRKNVILFNLPHFAFFSKTMRLMTKFLIRAREIGFAEVYRLDVDYAFGEFNTTTRLETIEFNLPSEQFIKDYENKKKAYNDIWLNQDITFLQLKSGKLKIPIQKFNKSNGNLITLE